MKITLILTTIYLTSLSIYQSLGDRGRQRDREREKDKRSHWDRETEYDRDIVKENNVYWQPYTWHHYLSTRDWEIEGDRETEKEKQ